MTSASKRVPVLDHVAIGTGSLTEGWALFAGLLGGRWAYGGDSPGYWWGQVGFSAGAKIELLTPTGGPDAAFLERFLASRGAGTHHLNFIVPDIAATLKRVRSVAIDPVQVNLDNPQWKEAFLHPKTAYGIVVQVAQQAVEPESAPPQELPEPGPATTFVAAEHHVEDLDGALRLFRDALAGEVVDGESTPGQVVTLSWPNGARLRLVRPQSEDARAALVLGGAASHLEFARVDGSFSDDEARQVAELAAKLGVRVELVSP